MFEKWALEEEKGDFSVTDLVSGGGYLNPQQGRGRRRIKIKVEEGKSIFSGLFDRDVRVFKKKDTF